MLVSTGKADSDGGGAADSAPAAATARQTAAASGKDCRWRETANCGKSNDTFNRAPAVSPPAPPVREGSYHNRPVNANNPASRPAARSRPRTLPTSRFTLRNAVAVGLAGGWPMADCQSPIQRSRRLGAAVPIGLSEPRCFG